MESKLDENELDEKELGRYEKMAIKSPSAPPGVHATYPTGYHPVQQQNQYPVQYYPYPQNPGQYMGPGQMRPNEPPPSYSEIVPHQDSRPLAAQGYPAVSGYPSEFDAILQQQSFLLFRDCLCCGIGNLHLYIEDNQGVVLLRGEGSERLCMCSPNSFNIETNDGKCISSIDTDTKPYPITLSDGRVIGFIKFILECCETTSLTVMGPQGKREFEICLQPAKEATKWRFVVENFTGATLPGSFTKKRRGCCTETISVKIPDMTTYEHRMLILHSLFVLNFIARRIGK